MTGNGTCPSLRALPCRQVGPRDGLWSRWGGGGGGCLAVPASRQAVSTRAAASRPDQRIDRRAAPETAPARLPSAALWAAAVRRRMTGNGQPTLRLCVPAKVARCENMDAGIWPSSLCGLQGFAVSVSQSRDQRQTLVRYHDSAPGEIPCITSNGAAPTAAI